MLDKSGKAYGLFLADNELIDATIIEAVDRNGKRNLEIATTLMNREKILCYHNRFHLNIPYVDKWNQCLYTAHKLVGQEKTYYWAFSPNMLDLNENKITSFEMYQQECSVSNT